MEKTAKIARENLPYLIQRMDRVASSSPDKKGVDTHFRFQYMGSSEFEFGTLPHSLKLMREHKDTVIQKVKLGTGSEQHVLWFVGRPGDLETATQTAEGLLEGSLRTKESTYLKETLRNDAYLRAEGWWAVQDKHYPKGPWVPFALFLKKDDAKVWLQCL